MDFYCGGQTSFCESMVPYGLTQITNWAFAFCGWRLRGGGCVQKCKKEEPPEKNFVQEEGLSPFCTPKKMTLTVEEELQNKDPPTSSFITIMKLFFQKFFSAHVA
jgi:hypothetical protein